MSYSSSSSSAQAQANKFTVSAVDWRTELVTIEHPDKTKKRVTVNELLHAAQQPDSVLAEIYKCLWQRAKKELAAAKQEEINRCPGHKVTEIKEYGFTRQLGDNPAAHGNICVHEYCRCGAVRMTNVNGPHHEGGRWE